MRFEVGQMVTLSADYNELLGEDDPFKGGQSYKIEEIVAAPPHLLIPDHAQFLMIKNPITGIKTRFTGAWFDPDHPDYKKV